MLFRSNDGKLIEIKKQSFINDKLYYQKIINIKKSTFELKETLQNKYNYETNKQSKYVT